MKSVAAIKEDSFEEWKVVKIGDIAEIKGGKRLPKGDSLLDLETPYPYIRVLDFKNRSVDSNNLKFLSKDTFEKIKNYRISSEDVYISIAGTIGLAGIIPPELDGANLTENAAKLCDLKGIDKFFLAYALDSQFVKSQIENLTMHANQPKLALFRIKNIKIPLPSLETQKKIVEILENAEKLKKWRAEADELADELLKSVFLDMFGDPINNPKGWETKKGEDYCQKLSVGVVIKPASYYVDKGVIALRSLNIKPNRIDLNDLAYFSSDDHLDKLSKSILKEGDVVLVRTGVTGTAAVIPRELDGCNCIDLIIARPNVKIINPVYLAFFFNSENGKNLVLSKEVGGIQKHFNVKAIKNLEIPIPPIELQNQFAEIVKQVETLKTGQKQSKQQIDNLFNALMQKAFKGELTC